jgi:CheY-like chemotaxis protein|tara:strand:+ start:224 stop:355 length:132 start_codon:yes stop_codon:yes gene_type:complete
LSDKGYQILKAASGEEAIEKSKTLLLDLVIMDVVLPDIDGQMQ